MKKILLTIFSCLLTIISMQADSYVKVTSTPADWSGDYLIVYETGKVAFNGGLSKLDATSNTIAVDIVDNEIAADNKTNAAKFTIEAVSGGYAIKSASGNYIGVTSYSNGLKQNVSAATYKPHTISLQGSGDVVITIPVSDGKTMTMRYNKASDQSRFRYFKSGQQAIQLYKYTSGGGEEDTTPILASDVDKLSFKTSLGTVSDSQTIALTVKNIENVTVTCDHSAFQVSDKGNYTYDVTFTAPNEEGITNGTLTFTADGVDPVQVALVGEAVNEVTIWEEDFVDDTTPYALTYTNGGTTTKIFNDKLAGGTAPELLISKGNGVMSVNITDLKGCSGNLTLTFVSNHADYLTVSSSTTGVTVSKNTNTHYTVTIPSGLASLNLTFKNTNSSNTRVDDFLLVGTAPIPENIESERCYSIAVGTAWDEPEGCWYAAKFINKNTGAYTWAAVSGTDAMANGYIFYLAAGNTPVMRAKTESAAYRYTHVEFVQLPASYEVPEVIRDIELTGVVGYKTTGELFYDGESSTTYDLAMGVWKDIATCINDVDVVNAITYTHGIVTATGVIEVFDMSGSMVARANNYLNISGLNSGIYIVRCGENVRKVVR